MDDLRRIGAEAGVLAGIALAWLLLGMVVIFPAAGLSFAAQMNPHKFLPFVHMHEFLFWTVNILGGVLSAVMSIIWFQAISDRFTSDAPAITRIGALFGVFGGFSFAASALLRQYGMGPLTALYAGNQAGAVHAFRGMSGVLSASMSIGEIFTGLAALAYASVLMAEKRYRNQGLVGVVTGAALILATFIPHAVLTIIGLLATAVWYVWTSLALREEVGPAFFRWAYMGAREGARTRRTT